METAAAIAAEATLETLNGLLHINLLEYFYVITHSSLITLDINMKFTRLGYSLALRSSVLMFYFHISSSRHDGDVEDVFQMDSCHHQ